MPLSLRSQVRWISDTTSDNPVPVSLKLPGLVEIGFGIVTMDEVSTCDDPSRMLWDVRMNVRTIEHHVVNHLTPSQRRLLIDIA